MLLQLGFNTHPKSVYQLKAENRIRKGPPKRHTFLSLSHPPTHALSSEGKGLTQDTVGHDRSVMLRGCVCVCVCVLSSTDDSRSVIMLISIVSSCRFNESVRARSKIYCVCFLTKPTVNPTKSKPSEYTDRNVLMSTFETLGEVWYGSLFCSTPGASRPNIHNIQILKSHV